MKKIKDLDEKTTAVVKKALLTCVVHHGFGCDQLESCEDIFGALSKKQRDKYYGRIAELADAGFDSLIEDGLLEEVEGGLAVTCKGLATHKLYCELCQKERTGYEWLELVSRIIRG